MLSIFNKKRPNRQSFISILSVDSTDSKSKKSRSPSRSTSTMALQAFHGNEVPKDLGRNPEHDESIEEMATMSLDDTPSDQLKADPGKRLSQVSRLAIANEENDLSQHASSRFGVENTLGLRHPSPVPSASDSQLSGRNSSEDEINTSSHRLSKSIIGSPNQVLDMSAPESASRPIDAEEINSKVRAMIEANDKLKPTKKKGRRRSKMMTKWKSLLRLRKRGREETPASMTADIQLRLNEGRNLNGNDKIKKMTGHGTIDRKPVADDGKSLKSRPSHDQNDPSSESPSLPDVPKIPQRMPRRLRRTQSSLTAYDNDFDQLISSSPDEGSTPRVRLEPRLIDGKKILKIAPIDPEPQPELRFQRSQNFEPESHTDNGNEVINSVPDITYKKHPTPEKRVMDFYGDKLAVMLSLVPEDQTSTHSADGVRTNISRAIDSTTNVHGLENP